MDTSMKLKDDEAKFDDKYFENNDFFEKEIENKKENIFEKKCFDFVRDQEDSFTMTQNFSDMDSISQSPSEFYRNLNPEAKGFSPYFKPAQHPLLDLRNQ